MLSRAHHRRRHARIRALPHPVHRRPLFVLSSCSARGTTRACGGTARLTAGSPRLALLVVPRDNRLACRYCWPDGSLAPPAAATLELSLTRHPPAPKLSRAHRAHPLSLCPRLRPLPSSPAAVVPTCATAMLARDLLSPPCVARCRSPACRRPSTTTSLHTEVALPSATSPIAHLSRPRRMHWRKEGIHFYLSSFLP